MALNLLMKLCKANIYIYILERGMGNNVFLTFKEDLMFIDRAGKDMADEKVRKTISFCNIY